MSYTWDEDREPQETGSSLSYKEWEARFGQSSVRAGKITAIITFIIMSCIGLLHFVFQYLS